MSSGKVEYLSVIDLSLHDMFGFTARATITNMNINHDLTRPTNLNFPARNFHFKFYHILLKDYVFKYLKEIVFS